MKIPIYDAIPNTGKLQKTDAVIDILRGRWLQGTTSHPMKYIRCTMFENRYVYFLHFFGDDSKKPHHGEHIVLTFWQNQRFLMMQGSHWIQKNDNVKWLFGIIGGAAIGYVIKTLTSSC